MEKVQHPYECLAMGHAGGSRTFFAAPPDWFEAKSMTTPRNCPECRAWVKAQVDAMKTCNCGSKIRLSANSKISYFKKDGPYVPPEECRPCREGNRPPKGVKKRPTKKEREEEKKEEQPSEFQDLKLGLSPQPRTIITEGAYYNKTIMNYKTKESEQRGTHIEHHIPGSVNDWTTRSVANDKGLHEPTSPSTFATGTTLESLLAFAQSSLLRASNDTVREYRQTSSRIIRVTFNGNHNGLELTFLDETPNGLGVASTYDNVTVTYIVGQKWYKES